MSKHIKKIIRKFAHSLNFEPEIDLSLTGIMNTRFFPIGNPTPKLKLSSDPYSIPFEIDIENIITSTGFSFSTKGWHPFVETLKEYKINKELKYEDSTLFKLYNNFIPKNFFESLFTSSEPHLEPLSLWPCYGQLLANVWLLNKKKLNHYLEYLKKRTGLVGWIYYGPHSEEYGINELNRLINVYKLIERNGYKETSAKDFINGYFLEKDGKYKFVLLEGNHRISILKHLGYNKVKVVIQKGHPTVIKYSKLKQWLNAYDIVFDLLIAEKIFNHLFYENGDKALQIAFNKRKEKYINKKRF